MSLEGADRSVARDAATPRLPGRPWRALRHPDDRLYFWGQSVSLLGSWIQRVALGSHRLTGSAARLGSIAFLAQAPRLVVAPFAGILIDRSNPKRLMLVLQLLMLRLPWTAGQGAPRRGWRCSSRAFIFR